MEKFKERYVSTFAAYADLPALSAVTSRSHRFFTTVDKSMAACVKGEQVDDGVQYLAKFRAAVDAERGNIVSPTSIAVARRFSDYMFAGTKKQFRAASSSFAQTLLGYTTDLDTARTVKGFWNDSEACAVRGDYVNIPSLSDPGSRLDRLTIICRPYGTSLLYASDKYTGSGYVEHVRLHENESEMLPFTVTAKPGVLDVILLRITAAVSSSTYGGDVCCSVMPIAYAWADGDDVATRLETSEKIRYNYYRVASADVDSAWSSMQSVATYADLFDLIDSLALGAKPSAPPTFGERRFPVVGSLYRTPQDWSYANRHAISIGTHTTMKIKNSSITLI